MRSLRAGVARVVWLGLGVPMVAAACHGRASTTLPAEAGAQAERPPEVPTEGFVVLPWGTRTYLEPRLGGVSARLGWPGMAPPPWPTTGYVARVVGQREGFVEIAPIMPSSTEQHCGPLLDGEGFFDVRLYVSPWSLAPVLAREHEVTIDGAVLSLRPGALAQPIPDDPQGRSAIAAGGLRLRAVVPDDAMALVYAAPAPVPMPPQRNWHLPEGRPFSFDGWPLEVELGFGQDVAIASVTPEGDHQRVELMSPCARVYANANEAPVSWGHPSSEPGFMEHGFGAPEPVPEDVLDAAGILAPIESGIEGGIEGGVFDSVSAEGSFSVLEGTLVGSAPLRPEHVFEQGTPVYLSPAGSAAGTLADLRVFTEDGWRAGDRLCFNTSFGSRFDPLLPVCLPLSEGRLRNPATDFYDFLPIAVRPSTLRVEGGLAEPAVDRALRALRPELRRCVSEAMGHGAWPTGEVGLELDVDGKGAVTHLRLLSPAIPVLTDCVVAAAQGWSMPAPADAKPASVVFAVQLVPR